jgi:hypothetical protein
VREVNNASLHFGAEWSDDDSNVIHRAMRTILCPFAVAVEGSLPIPVGTAQGIEIDLPFEGVAVAATFILIENHTGQELGMAWGGNFSPNLPDGGVLIRAFPVAPAAGFITALRFWLTKAQTAPGKIVYLFGGS